MRRSRFIATELAQEKRLDTFSPATGAHTGNVLPLQHLWLKDRAKQMQGQGDYNVVMGWLDVKDAFLMVDQDQPILVHLHGQAFVIRKNLPGQRMGAKQWYQHLRDHLATAFGYTFCSEQPCLAKSSFSTFLIHVDDILFVGKQSYWEETFLKGMREKFSVNHSKLEGEGSSVTFLKRKITDMGDWLMLTPGTSVEKVVRLFEDVFGTARKQRSHAMPVYNCRMIQTSSVQKTQQHTDLWLAYAYTSVESVQIWCSQSKSLRQVCPHHHLQACKGWEKLWGTWYVGDVGVIEHPSTWSRMLETYSDADWSSNKSHRRSTSCSIHLVNGSFMHGSSRGQKTISLSSCESELHSLVSAACDGLFLMACLRFVLGEEILHLAYIDSSSARQLASRQGCGRVRHLSGKVLWIQEKTNSGELTLRQVGTTWNMADVGTKALPQHRFFVLMNKIGMVYVNTFEDVCIEEHQRQVEKSHNSQQLQKAAKLIMRLCVAMGLEPTGAAAQQCTAPGVVCRDQVAYGTIFMVVFLLACAMVGLAMYGWKKLKKAMRDVDHSGAIGRSLRLCSVVVRTFG